MDKQLTQNERHVLIHALTGSNRTQTVYRNYYSASKGHQMEHVLSALVEKGLMKKGHKFSPTGFYYHCTEKGAESVKLHLPKD